MEGRYLSIDEPQPLAPSLTFDSQEQVTTTLTDVRDAKWLTRTWEEARKKANHSDRGYVLVLDEIQKIPQWSETVKGLWDADRAADCPLHVVVLGSAPLLMQQGLTESLAGRFELIRVSHWSFSEMVDAFNFDLASYIYFGGYPGSAYLIKDQPRWREYIRSSLIEPNIERDILSMIRVNKPALLKRAFELGSNYSGQILSYTKMQGQLQDAGNTTTLAHYLDLLSNAGLLTGLQKYAGQQHRRRGASPKLNVLNTSFMAVNSGYSFEEAQADRTFWGRLVESTVGAHLFNTGMPDIRLHYWRESPYEVDFVLEKGRRLIGIEVKSTPRGNNSDGLAIFQERFSPERTLLVGGQGIPLEEFLTQPATYWFDSS
jgi:predicted AAA+ superfamily ATPase